MRRQWNVLWFPKIFYLMTSWRVMTRDLFVIGSSKLIHWTDCFSSRCWICCSQCGFLFLWFWFFFFRHLALFKISHFVIWQLFWRVILKGHLESWRSWGTPTWKVSIKIFPRSVTSVSHFRDDKLSALSYGSVILDNHFYLRSKDIRSKVDGRKKSNWLYQMKEIFLISKVQNWFLFSFVLFCCFLPQIS